MSHHYQQRDISRDYHELFDKCIECYFETLGQIGPGTAHYGEGQSFKPRPATAAEFRADVGKASQIALQGKPHLSAAFRYLVREVANLPLPEHKPTAGERVGVVQCVGKMFAVRKLHPGTYFRHIHKRVVWH